MLRSRFLCAALIGSLAAIWPQFSRSAPPDPPQAKRPPGAEVPQAKRPPSAEVTVDSPFDSLLRDQQLIAQLIQVQVDAALLHARASLATDPSTVTQELKTLLHQVLAAPELRADQRAGLRQRLETTIAESVRRAADVEQQQLQHQLSRAAALERARIAANLDNRQERLKQLMDRFESLLSEGRYDLAESVANQVGSDESPDAKVTGVSALVNVGLSGAAREALTARIKRQQGVVHSLEQVELAGVALPGDEPIIYAQAERWQELTARRSKYARTDLHNSTPAEARLNRALSEPTNFDFVELPLGEAVAYLKDLHGIEIQFDTKALQDESIDMDVPVTRKLSGISLRSALRLLLGSLDLTYTIENEVLMITTLDHAAHRLVTKVYPVGELVLPIVTPNMGSLGGMTGPNRNGQQGGNNGNNGNMMFNPMGQNQNNNQFGQGVF